MPCWPPARAVTSTRVVLSQARVPSASGASVGTTYTAAFRSSTTGPSTTGSFTTGSFTTGPGTAGSAAAGVAPIPLILLPRHRLVAGSPAAFRPYGTGVRPPPLLPALRAAKPQAAGQGHWGGARRAGLRPGPRRPEARTAPARSLDRAGRSSGHRPGRVYGAIL